MEYIKLNELCEINIGKTPSRNKEQYWGEGVNWLSISDLKRKYISDTKEQITEEAIRECNMKIVPKNTVVMSFKLSIGKTAILDKAMYTNEAIANFPIKKQKILLSEYLYYALGILNFDNTDRAVMGATLNKAKLNELIIPYCNIDRQKKIVELLNKAQELIDKRKTQIEALDELVKSKFIEMFGNAVQNSHGYLTKTIDELCQSILGGGTPAKSHPEYYGGDIPWVTPKDMKSDTINTAQIYINEQGVSNSSAKMIPSNSLLMVIRSGILKHTLPIAINKCEVTVNQDMKAFVIKDDINIEYFFCVIKNIEKDLLSNVRSVTADNIEFSIIRNYQLPVPPKKMQNEFAIFVKQIDKLKFKMQKSLEEMENNFNSLMQRAFKGELFN